MSQVPTRPGATAVGCLFVLFVLSVVGVLIAGILRSCATTPPTTHAEERLADQDQPSAPDFRSMGEAAVQAMLKDPASAEFESTHVRLAGGAHVACGYVNAKNSFGAMAGAQPWLVVFERHIGLVRSYSNNGRFVRLWNRYCSGPADGAKPPPTELWGIKFGKAPPVSLKPYDANHFVWVFRSHPPSAYLGVPISSAMIQVDAGRVFGGDMIAPGRESYGQLAAVISAKFGPPTSTERSSNQLQRWEWPHHRGLIQLYYGQHFDQSNVHVEGR